MPSYGDAIVRGSHPLSLLRPWSETTTLCTHLSYKDRMEIIDPEFINVNSDRKCCRYSGLKRKNGLSSGNSGRRFSERLSCRPCGVEGNRQFFKWQAIVPANKLLRFRSVRRHQNFVLRRKSKPLCFPLYYTRIALQTMNVFLQLQVFVPYILYSRCQILVFTNFFVYNGHRTVIDRKA